MITEKGRKKLVSDLKWIPDIKIDRLTDRGHSITLDFDSGQQFSLGSLEFTSTQFVYPLGTAVIFTVLFIRAHLQWS
jgi:hypothetical protein